MSRLAKSIGRALFRLSGWSMAPGIPDAAQRCVMIAAPHTSNWDIYYARIAFYLMDIPVRFTIKDEWMRPPVKGLLRRLGAIGINRRPRKTGDARPSATEAMARLFEQHDALAMMVTPEGTRKKRTEWKTGFYHVAKMAGVPIGLGYLDYANKVAGVGGMVWPSDDQQADFRKIMAFYQPIVGKHPEQFSIDLRYPPSSATEKQDD